MWQKKLQLIRNRNKNKIETDIKNKKYNIYIYTYNMVKNTNGGSGHKKFARKFTSAAKSNKLRINCALPKHILRTNSNFFVNRMKRNT